MQPPYLQQRCGGLSFFNEENLSCERFLFRIRFRKTVMLLVLALAVAFEAIAAVHRAVATGLERHLRGGATTVTNDFVHLAITTVGVLAVTASTAASGATARLILESLVSKELLLGTGEHELSTAIAAG